jgi:CRP/FNR family cyclic AMP-dependent transcriptional regulator
MTKHTDICPSFEEVCHYEWISSIGNITIMMNLGKYQYLAFFSGMHPEDIQLLAPYFTPETWVAGTVIFEQQDYAEYFYLLVSGEVTIRYKPHDGPMMNVTRVQPGGIFGWSAAMHNPSYTSGAICSLDSEVLRMRGTDLRAICDKHPELGRMILDRLAGVIAERKRNQQDQVTSILENGIRHSPEN